jgi:hypothetical protein
MDSFGDGLCCQFGPGSYNLFLNGNLVKVGGTFTSSETVVFLLLALLHQKMLL